MYESDIKIFELIQSLKSLGIFDFDYEFCNNIGLLKQNLSRIKQGKAHFTANHIQKICNVYKVNANWIFGTSEKVFNDRKQRDFKFSMPATPTN
jgi:transcriptional regulator with XRE-family HTH domain